MMAASMNDMQDMSMSPDIKVTRNCHDDNHEIIMMTIVTVHGDDQRTVDIISSDFYFQLLSSGRAFDFEEPSERGMGKKVYNNLI